MLYKMDFISRNNSEPRSKFIDHASDEVDATTKFMSWFFENHPNDGVKLTGITAIELIGEMEHADRIAMAAQEEGSNG